MQSCVDAVCRIIARQDPKKKKKKKLEKSRYSWLYATEDRTANTIRQILETWMQKVERQTGKMVVVIRTDNAKEFLALREWADTYGIELEFTEPYTPPRTGQPKDSTESYWK